MAQVIWRKRYCSDAAARRCRDFARPQRLGALIDQCNHHPIRKGVDMVSDHALLILILLLAVAVVLLASALVYQSKRMEAELKRISERMEKPEAASRG